MTKHKNLKFDTFDGFTSLWKTVIKPTIQGVDTSKDSKIFCLKY
ncbi:hypothetical protein [Candidatus Nitrosotalea okcheonensis]|uniref:Uncharacterized protein n=1 Tax=Candidatus Nitrosotalea okcheonensis TaxID=1903276 RepID=A0A2H1FIE7_9ARCH|nr:hypothetical protein [Candidatus Nitrosotalea okcheonensis]SMH72539.1 protein of unknown function [Candidatus Nitrosotalea okcheonensis]